MSDPRAEPVVLDASALLCWLLQEMGANAVAPHLEAGPSMSAANVAAVACKPSDRGLPAGDIDRIVADLPVQVVDLDPAAVRRMRRLRAAARPLGLSLGDLACIATGLAMGARLVTADGAWRKLPKPVASRVELVR